MKTLLESLRQRAQRDGGFANLAGGEYRVDATAWAILALSAAGVAKDLIERARASLADRQQGDGRVCISADHPESLLADSARGSRLARFACAS